MKVKVVELEKKEYNGKEILFPNEREVEVTDINLLHNNQRTICVGKERVRLTEKSYKTLRNELTKNKMIERITVL